MINTNISGNLSSASLAMALNGGFVTAHVYVNIVSASATGSLTINLAWTDNRGARTTNLTVPIAAVGSWSQILDVYLAPQAAIVLATTVVSAASLVYDLYSIAV